MNRRNGKHLLQRWTSAVVEECCFLKETFTKVKLKKQYSGILSFFPLPALPTMCLDY